MRKSMLALIAMLSSVVLLAGCNNKNNNVEEEVVEVPAETGEVALGDEEIVIEEVTPEEEVTGEVTEEVTVDAGLDEGEIVEVEEAPVIIEEGLEVVAE
jgi:protein involved in sex pheromone biosynthesis